MSHHCDVAPAGRRRLFWTFQQHCAHDEGVCGEDCAIPAHVLNDIKDAAGNDIGGTIDVANYVRSLALSILMTDNRRTTHHCPARPGRRGGHWADCLRGDGRASGSTIRDLPVGCNVQETLQHIRTALREDLNKMVVWGVASEIDVEADYDGGGSFTATALIRAFHENITVGVRGARLAGAWIWETQPQR